MRRIGTALEKRMTVDGYMAQIYRDNDWNEYRVKFYKTGAYMAGADYHTPDRQDAFDTAQHTVDLLSCNKMEKTK